MEFPALGDRCSLEGCGQLDFLPINCTFCSLLFCKDHLSPLAHVCPNRPDNIVDDEAVSKSKERWQFKCSFSTCKSKELVAIKCPKCVQHFCLQHRHPDQHGCEIESAEQKLKLSKKTAAVDPAKEQQSKIKEQISEKLEDVKKGSGPKATMAKKLALMKLKGRAEGDKAIPQTERVYFIVKSPSGENFDMFFSRVWSCGKVVDVIARRARIKNRNNQADAPKLHLFKDDLCLSNPFDTTLAQHISNNALEDGDSISMQYN